MPVVLLFRPLQIGFPDPAHLGLRQTELLANAPAALTETKRLAMESSFGGMAVDDDAYRRLVRLHSDKRQTAEAAEGLASFAEKRAGRWAAAKV